MKAERKPDSANPWHQLSDRIENAVLDACRTPTWQARSLHGLFKVAWAELGDGVYGSRMVRLVERHIDHMLATGKIRKADGWYVVGAEE